MSSAQTKCIYPDCKAEATMTVSKNLIFCYEHMKLWQFFTQCVFHMNIEINPFVDRFEEKRKQ